MKKIPRHASRSSRSFSNSTRGTIFRRSMASWVMPEREHLRQAFLDRRFAIGNHVSGYLPNEQALEICQRLISVDACLEKAYCLAIQALAAVNDRPGVIRLYEKLQTNLEDELRHCALNPDQRLVPLSDPIASSIRTISPTGSPPKNSNLTLIFTRRFEAVLRPAPCENKLIQTISLFRQRSSHETPIEQPLFAASPASDRQQLQLLLLLLSLGLLVVGAGAPIGGWRRWILDRRRLIRRFIA